MTKIAIGIEQSNKQNLLLQFMILFKGTINFPFQKTFFPPRYAEK